MKDSEIANLIGIKESMIYKIRKGQRHPSFNTMLKIEQATKWSINEQVQARRNGIYAEKFNSITTAENN